MTDTTAVYTNRVKGIRMTQYINETYGHNVIVLDCLYLSLELYLNDIITANNGNTNAPDKLAKDSVFNLLSEIEETDLTS